MSRFARVGPWAGVSGTGAGAASEPAAAADVARDDAAAASSMRGAADAPTTNANAISFGFAATAVLVSMFLLMAILEHLIKPGMASSSSSSSSPVSHDEDDADAEGRRRRRPRHRMGMGLAPGRPHPHDASPDKPSHSPKVEEPAASAPDLTVLMPGQRYPTFLAQPAPLAPCPREGVHWPPHVHRHDHERRLPP